jgi:UbiD family decarboxylases
MRDIRNFIQDLDEKGLLQRITRKIDKDTELMPLVRVQYDALDDEDRKAFLFENVTDPRGKTYNGSVAVSLLGTKDVYACAVGCERDQLRERITNGISNPIEPVMIAEGEEAPSREEVHIGDSLLEHEGLLEFPVPISTLGFDPAPFFTAPYWITKDPVTGGRNVGTYRAMIKEPAKTGIMISPPNQLGIQWRMCKAMGIPYLEAAMVIGAPIEVGMVSVSGLPYGVDELAVAGGIVGRPLRLTKGLTVDLDVPADAEIIIEGRIMTDGLEEEGPFGEFSGYMGMPGMHPVFEVTSISHRKNPVYQAIISEVPPSESSVMRAVFVEAQLYKLLKKDMGITGITDVAVHDTAGSNNLCVIQIDKKGPAQVWQALHAVSAFTPTFGKIVIAVDPDIDPYNAELINWAMCYHMQPHRDIEILKGKVGVLDPSCAPADASPMEQAYPMPNGNSIMLIDATRKWPYPPISLPPKDVMENAFKIWDEEGLPKVKPRKIWYGYELGLWDDELRQKAKDAVKTEK